MAITNCSEVWREVSDYIDGELSPSLRASVDQHAAGCERCTSVLRGTQNIVELYRDPRMLPVPASIRAGLRAKLGARLGAGLGQRIQARAIPQRGTLRGLMVSLSVVGAVAALLLFAGVTSHNQVSLLSPHAQPAVRLPSDTVFVTAKGKLFHRAGCPLIHGPEKLLSAQDAIGQGYAPCIRCMKEALASAEITPQGPPLETSLLQ